MYLREFNNRPVQDVLTDMELSKDSVRIAVYGTLRKEGTAHRFLDGMEYKGTMHIGSGTAMWDTGAFPFVITGRLPDVPVRVLPTTAELYSPPDGMLDDYLEKLDAYEGVPHLYNRSYYLANGYRDLNTRKVVPKTILVIYYTWARLDDFNPDQYELVPGGDWIEFKKGNDRILREQNEAERDGPRTGYDPLRRFGRTIRQPYRGRTIRQPYRLDEPVAMFDEVEDEDEYYEDE